MNVINLSPKQLRRAANIQDKIAGLQKKLSQILGASDEAAPKRRGPRKMSASAKAKIAAAARARWAKVKGAKVKKAKRKMSAAGRARIIAAQKARWAKVKAAKKA
jgi:hypothetical protein